MEQQLRNILNIKLANNEVNLIDKILEYCIEECSFCEDSTFEGYEEVEYPYERTHYESEDEDCKNESTHKLHCYDCKIKNCCTKCSEYCCEGCYNKFPCDYCENIFCEDDSRSLLYCNGCELKFCCRVFYKFIGLEGENQWYCEECMDIIQPEY